MIAVTAGLLIYKQKKKITIFPSSQIKIVAFLHDYYFFNQRVGSDSPRAVLNSPTSFSRELNPTSAPQQL